LKAKSDFTGNGTSDLLWINPANDIVGHLPSWQTPVKLRWSSAVRA
jgi:hypothetical protein